MFCGDRHVELLPLSEQDIQILYDKFTAFKTLTNNELSLNDAIVSSYVDGKQEHRMDKEVKFPVSYNYMCCMLFKAAKIVLLTIHSNAEIK